MIPIRRIACASFETPDIERLTDYYVNVIGLSLAAKEKDAVYLASTVQKGRSSAVKGRSAVLTRCEAGAFVDHPPPQAIHLTHDGLLSTDRGKMSLDIPFYRTSG